MVKTKKIGINEIYSCIQGEGKYAGIPHILVRMVGCALRCQFINSICDTAYASWFPEKGDFTWGDVVTVYEKYDKIKYTMITGGGPTNNPELLQQLVDLSKSYGHFVTIETEGSAFVHTNADFISLSPKLINSIPTLGSIVSFGNQEVIVDEKIIAKHLEGRSNYTAMANMIQLHKDYQLKPVISDMSNLLEVAQIQKELNVPNDKVYLMPEGDTDEKLNLMRQKLMNFCANNSEYNYTDRIHITAFGTRRGV